MAAKVQIKSDKTKTIINYLNFVDYEKREFKRTLCLYCIALRYY